MNDPTIATKLLILLASGGTIERAVTGLPKFKAQVESAYGQLKSAGRCTDAEVRVRADRLPGIVRRKDEAIRRQDFDLAANIRAEECALFESFWLRAPRGHTGHAIMHVGIDKQIQDLAALLQDANAA